MRFVLTKNVKLLNHLYQNQSKPLEKMKKHFTINLVIIPRLTYLLCSWVKVC